MQLSPVCRLLALLLVVASVNPTALADDTPHFPCGACFGISADSTQPVIVPLESTEVVLDVKPGLMEGQVIQTFVNRTTTALEATYLYPLPPAATVTGFELRYRDRVVRSEVREKEAARAVYETAKAEGKKAALLAQQDPSLFSTAVANFLPGETVHVVLRFTQPLDLRADAVEVRFPMVTGTKYFPADAFPGTSGNAAPDVTRRPADLMTDQHVYAFDVQVAGFPASTVTSSTHAILVAPATNDPQRLRVSLAREITIPDRDFVLRIETRRTGQPQSTVVTQHTETGDYGLLAVFPPSRPAARAVRRPRDVLFLVDHSGSMEGTRMESAKLGVIGCLNALMPQDRFHLVIFDSVTEFFRNEWTLATVSELDVARRYVRGIQARGGTEMQPALAASFAKFEPSERDQIIIFLTDGDVGNTNSLLNLIQTSIGRVRLFPFGIGGAPNAALIQKMAELGRGQARFITNDRDVERELTDLFATLDAPVLTDVKLALQDAQGGGIAYTSFPETLPDVFLGRPLQSVFRWQQGMPAGAVIEGKENGRPVQYRVALNPAAMRGDGLEKEFGRRLYDDTGRLLRQAQTEAERVPLRQEMLATALQFQLVTERTSRVAVDQSVARAPEAPLVSQQVGQYGPADQKVGSASAVSQVAGYAPGGPGVVVLECFCIQADSDRGYLASANTLSGRRFQSADRTSGIHVTTREFLEAVGARTLDDALPFAVEAPAYAGQAQRGAEVGLLDGLPIATVVDWATVERVAFEPFGPAWSEVSQLRANRPWRSSLLAQVGDDGMKRLSLRAAASLPDADGSPVLAILSWARLPETQKSLLLETRKNVATGAVRANAQWRDLDGYGQMRLVRGSLELKLREGVMLDAAVAWHELKRDDPRQFRLGGPASRYEGLGFFNLDLLTAETKRLRDAIAQLELSGRPRDVLKQTWSLRARWHRQESQWVTPFGNDPVAPVRDTHRIDGGYTLTPLSRLTLNSQFGWAESRTPRTTREHQELMRGSAGLTWELPNDFQLFGTVSSEENLPWISTGAWREAGSSVLAVVPKVENRRAGEIGLRSASGRNISGEVGLFGERVSGLAYRDWAWEQSRDGAEMTSGDGAVRTPLAFATGGHGWREGWLASTVLQPSRSLSMKASWYQAWKNSGPYRGGNRQGSLAGRYQFFSDGLRGFMVGASASYRDALTFNDGFQLQGGVRGDLMLGWRTSGLGRETIIQLNVNNVAGRSWQPTRFTPDLRRTVLFTIAHGF